jgi:hypothetical protein
LTERILLGTEIALKYNRNNLKPNIVGKARPRAIAGRNDEWTHNTMDSMNYDSDEHFFLCEAVLTKLIGKGLNHDKK